MENQSLKIKSLLDEIEEHLTFAHFDKDSNKKLELAKQSLQGIEHPFSTCNSLDNIIKEIAKNQPQDDSEIWVPDRKKRLESIPNEIKELCQHSFFEETPATITQAEINEYIISKTCSEIENTSEKIMQFLNMHKLKAFNVILCLLPEIKSLWEKVTKEKKDLQSIIAKLKVKELLGNNDSESQMNSEWLQFFDNSQIALKCLCEMLEKQKQAKEEGRKNTPAQELLKIFVSYANKELYTNANCGANRLKKIWGKHHIIVGEKTCEEEKVLKAFEDKENTSKGQ